MNIRTALHELHNLEPTSQELLDAVTRGLSESPKTLPSKFFYDARGSELFDQICELPEYYPTRTELALLKKHAGDIAEIVGRRVALVELGSGAGTKIRLLLDRLDDPAMYVPIDISRQHLADAARDLANDHPHLPIVPVCADYTARFELPSFTDVAAGRKVAFFPGSTIGNFKPPEAQAFLHLIAGLLGPGSMMIVGVDLPKDAAILEPAYDDAAGVTAAFNKNILFRINRELGADFAIESFDHKSYWNAAESRIEMHLVSRVRQHVRIGRDTFELTAGEPIHTEYSYKYSKEHFIAMARSAGYESRISWVDDGSLFSVHMLEAL